MYSWVQGSLPASALPDKITYIMGAMTVDLVFLEAGKPQNLLWPLILILPEDTKWFFITQQTQMHNYLGELPGS